MNHFAEKCLERGITSSDPYLLADEIERAVKIGADEYIEHVIDDLNRDTSFCRFRVPEGIFYAVMGGDGRLRTVFTQEMMRGKKHRIKRERKGL